MPAAQRLFAWFEKEKTAQRLTSIGGNFTQTMVELDALVGLTKRSDEGDSYAFVLNTIGVDVLFL